MTRAGDAGGPSIVRGFLLAIALFTGCDSGSGGGGTEPAPGPLLLKARAYDSWHEAHHQPFYGATVNVQFTDESLTQPQHYDGLGDSTIWTGTYLASQAFRYAVTREAQAKANAVKTATALHNHLQVTGRPGFIARYRSPAGPMTVAECSPDDENCHLVASGEFAGDVWLGNTSRDQYTGWFFGMSLAHDLVDDEPMRAMIREDVREVIDALAAQDWKIVDVDGVQTTAGPDVLLPMRESWTLIAAHVIDEPAYWELFETWADPSQEKAMDLANVSFFNRYAQYYGNNLSHQNAYNLHRLSERDFPDAHAAAVERFERQTHRWVHLTHNPFFEEIHLAAISSEDHDLIASVVEDLVAFRDAPNRELKVYPPAAPLDPASILLYGLQQAIPILPDIMGTVHIQSLDAYPVLYQCSTDFLWQRNPFAIECGGGNLAYANPGVDYLVAYWMSRFHRFVGPEL